jgi:hypothetical protein
MLNQKTAISGLALFAVAIAGACADAPPTEPRAIEGDVALFGTPVNPQGHDTHRDAQMVRIAEAVPGFGGFYTGADGTLAVVMKAGASAEPLRAQLGAFNVVEGQYDFIELDAMHRQVSPVLGLEGVVYTDADEVANRVAIGVENAAARANVERALRMLGLPADAVVIRDAAPIFAMQTLRDRVRPVAGGLQINWPGIPGFVCTLGFNVRSPTAPAQGFITNSHCTVNEYGTGPTGTPYWQHRQDVPDTFIGTEVHDLPTFAGGACPAGRQCRWSDSAGARYAPGVSNAFARIYRTTGMGSLTIDPANPMFSITAERAFPNPGDTMHKVGRTTGWTSGTVTSSCADTNVGGTSIPNLTLLCQEHVTGGPNVVGGGDSGSPVFDNVVGNNVRLVGLLWGGGGAQSEIFVFSAMNEIRFEHPAAIQGHQWRTFPPPPAP